MSWDDDLFIDSDISMAMFEMTKLQQCNSVVVVMNAENRMKLQLQPANVNWH